jgi:hypothetical protein
MIIEIHRPELEAMIRAKMETGRFHDVEDVLMQAFEPPPLNDVQTSDSEPRTSLAEFLLNSPLRDSGLILERQKDYPRPADLLTDDL